MSKKKTHNEYVAELNIKNSNIKVIDDYIDAKTPIKHLCKIHNICWMISPSNALNGRGCSQCRSEKISNALKDTDEQYKQKLSFHNPNIEVVGKYVNSKTPILHKCKIHNYIWMAYPYNTLDGKGCLYCRGDKIRSRFVWSHEEYVNALKEKNRDIVPIDKYVNMNTKILHRCNIDNCEWLMSPNAILNQSCGCPQCNSKLRTHQQYVDELFVVNPNIKVVGEYLGSNIAILHRCLIDGYEWNTSPSHTLKGTRCPKCAGVLKYTHEEYVAKAKEINPDIKILDEYNGGKQQMLFQCKKGHLWKSRASVILEGKGCPLCQETNGERLVRQWLEKNNINYEYQKTFDGCNDKKRLPFDFYLPQYNMCIEFDGAQHFKPVDFAGKGEEWALKQFQKGKYHDDIKNQYCQDNNIRLLRISYLQDISFELSQFLI